MRLYKEEIFFYPRSSNPVTLATWLASVWEIVEEMEKDESLSRTILIYLEKSAKKEALKVIDRIKKRLVGKKNITVKYEVRKRN